MSPVGVPIEDGLLLGVGERLRDLVLHVGDNRDSRIRVEAPRGQSPSSEDLSVERDCAGPRRARGELRLGVSRRLGDPEGRRVGGFERPLPGVRRDVDSGEQSSHSAGGSDFLVERGSDSGRDPFETLGGGVDVHRSEGGLVTSLEHRV